MRVLEIGHHILSDKTIERMGDIQTDHDARKESDNNPVVHMRPRQFRAMRPHRVRNNKLSLSHAFL